MLLTKSSMGQSDKHVKFERSCCLKKFLLMSDSTATLDNKPGFRLRVGTNSEQMAFIFELYNHATTYLVMLPMKRLNIRCQNRTIGSLVLSSRYKTNYIKTTCSFQWNICSIWEFVKETRSVTMNIFRKKYFLFKSFVKKIMKLCFHNKYVQYSWKLHGTVNNLIKTSDFSLVRNYMRPSNNSRQLIFKAAYSVTMNIFRKKLFSF